MVLRLNMFLCFTYTGCDDTCATQRHQTWSNWFSRPFLPWLPYFKANSSVQTTGRGNASNFAYLFPLPTIFFFRCSFKTPTLMTGKTIVPTYLVSTTIEVLPSFLIFWIQKHLPVFFTCIYWGLRSLNPVATKFSCWKDVIWLMLSIQHYLGYKQPLLIEVVSS